MIFVYKLMHGLLGVRREEFFLDPPVGNTHGHRFKVRKVHAVTRARRNLLCGRTVSD